MPGSGMVRGFLFGVVVSALIFAGVVSYGYLRFRDAISPETVRAQTQSILRRLVGGGVTVGEADLRFPDRIVLQQIRFENDQGLPVFTAGEIELTARGGLSGLTSGNFSQVVVDQPKLYLAREQGTWNLAPFDHLLAFADQTSSSAAATTSQPSQFPETVLLNEIEIAFRDSGSQESYESIHITQLNLNQNSATAKWQVLAKGCDLQIKPTQQEFLIADFVTRLNQLLPQAPGDSDSPEALAMLDQIVVESLSVYLAYNGYTFSIENLHLESQDISQQVKLWTSPDKKKTDMFLS